MKQTKGLKIRFQSFQMIMSFIYNGLVSFCLYDATPRFVDLTLWDGVDVMELLKTATAQHLAGNAPSLEITESMWLKAQLHSALVL